MNKHAIRTAARPAGGGRLQVVLRCARGDMRRVTVCYGDRFAPPGGSDPPLDGRLTMCLEAADDLFHYWTAELDLRPRRFGYYFILDDGREKCCYGEVGFCDCPPPSPLWRWCFEYPYLWNSEADEPPAWAREAVIYEIFPERFANGDPGNDPAGSRPWGEIPGPGSFFGGDLQGIAEHLGYLEDLGINCLYLTPIFRAPSNHKYDTADYFEVDPAFGGKSAARDLVEACHSRGIRVVLDGVFNHSGNSWEPFRDAVRRGRRSPYYTWFNIDGDSVRTGPGRDCNYETFANGVPNMPKLRTDHPGVREYLLGAAEYWTRELGLDGWRLDVGNEIHPGFLREFRRRIRAVNPEALIVGEVWHEAQDFLRGDQMDAVMNYTWQQRCIDFFARRSIGLETLADSLNNQRMWYRESVTSASWSMLDSHDRCRLLTACGGDGSRLKLAAVFQFTSVGVPLIYYGTEIGLAGGEDPDCRRCFPWDERDWDMEIHAHYKQLIRLRRDFPVFSHGRQIDLLVDAASGLYVYARADGDECALVCLNTGDRQAALSPDAVRKAVDEWGLAGIKDRTGRTIFDTHPGQGGSKSLTEGVLMQPGGAAVWMM